MHVEPVDERDSSWENFAPRFRVYFFDTAHGITSTYDVTDADVLEVTDWARRTAGTEWLYAVGLVEDTGAAQEDLPRQGVVWLLGADLVNTLLQDLDEEERRILERMEARRTGGPPGPDLGD